MPLMQFIPHVSKRVLGPYGNLEEPQHLEPLVSIFDRVQRGETVMAAVSTPPQHGKTAVELYGAARYLLKYPAKSVVFATYGLTFAYERSVDARLVAQAAGLTLVTDKVSHWRTSGYGGFIATSLGGPLTGEPSVKLILIDDPYSGRADAENAAYREKVHRWLASDALARTSPGTSVIVTHTRWHPDDEFARLEKMLQVDGSHRFEAYNLPAIKDDGQPLWPAHRSIEWLEQRRLDSEYDWWSMYMGSPRPPGESLFSDTYFYTKLPTTGLRYAIGIDLAYTEKTHSDYSVAVVLAESGGTFYVVEVLRMQCRAPDFASKLVALAARYPNAKMRAYAYGPEVGVIDFIRGLGLKQLKAVRPDGGGDKFVRAQPVAGAWKRGLVQLPQRVEDQLPSGVLDDAWVNAFTSEVLEFTGISDLHDDQVDALAPAYDLLAKARSSGFAGGGVRPGVSVDELCG